MGGVENLFVVLVVMVVASAYGDIVSTEIPMTPNVTYTVSLNNTAQGAALFHLNQTGESNIVLNVTKAGGDCSSIQIARQVTCNYAVCEALACYNPWSFSCWAAQGGGSTYTGPGAGMNNTGASFVLPLPYGMDPTVGSPTVNNICGCKNTTTPTSANWYFGVSNTRFQSSICILTIRADVTDVCNGRGQYYSYNERVCKCLPGFGGKFCTDIVVNLPLNSLQNLALSPQIQTYTFDIYNQDLNFTVRQSSGNCTSVNMYVGINCGTCTQSPLYNFIIPGNSYNYDKISVTPTENLIRYYQYGLGASSVVYKSWVPIAYPRCGCDFQLTESWFLTFSSAAVCNMELTVSALRSCSGNGLYNLTYCECDPGWAGDRCEIATIPIVPNQLYVGSSISYQKVIYQYESQGRLEHLNFTFSGFSGYCSNTYWYVGLTCGGCVVAANVEITYHIQNLPFFYHQYGDKFPKASYEKGYSPLNTCNCNTTNQVWTVTVMASNIPACNFALNMTAKPVCNGHGDYVYSKGTCNCHDTYFGANCNYTYQFIMDSSKTRVIAYAGQPSFFTYGALGLYNGWRAYTATLEPVSGDCTNVSLTSMMACDLSLATGCNPEASFEPPSPLSSTALPQTSNMDRYSVLRYYGTCGCDYRVNYIQNQAKNPMWRVVNMKGKASPTCVYDLVVNERYDCFNCSSLLGVCQSDGTCKCHNGEQSVRCEDTLPETKEIYFNDAQNYKTSQTFATDYFPGQVKKYWIQVGPTNSEIVITLTATKSYSDVNFGDFQVMHVYYGYEKEINTSISNLGTVKKFPYFTTKTLNGTGTALTSGPDIPIVITLSGPTLIPGRLFISVSFDANFSDILYEGSLNLDNTRFLSLNPTVDITDKYSLIITSVGVGLMGIVIIVVGGALCIACRSGKDYLRILPTYIGDDPEDAVKIRTKLFNVKSCGTSEILMDNLETKSITIKGDDGQDDGGIIADSDDEKYAEDDDEVDSEVERQRQKGYDEGISGMGGLFGDDENEEAKKDDGGDANADGGNADGGNADGEIADVSGAEQPPKEKESLAKESAKAAFSLAISVGQDDIKSGVSNQYRASKGVSGGGGGGEGGMKFNPLDHVPNTSLSCKFLEVIPVVGLGFLQFFVDIIKAIFNIVLINTSFGLVDINLPDIPSLRLAVPDFLSFLRRVYDYMQDAYQIFNFMEEASKNWNCGGAVTLFAPFAVFFAGLVLFVILRKDLLLAASMGLKRNVSMRSKSRIMKLVAEKSSQFLVFLLFYGLQMSITVIQQIMTKVFTIHLSCGSFDVIALLVGRIYAIAIFILMGFYLFFSFAGNPYQKGNPGDTFFGAVFNVIKLTLGIWDDRLTVAHRIKFNAKLYDDDEEDDDTQHETVISITAKSKSLFWIAFPGCAIVAKFAEAVNSPPIFVHDPNLQLQTSLMRRRVQWTRNVIEFILTITTALTAKYVTFILIVISLIPKAIDIIGFDMYKLFKRR